MGTSPTDCCGPKPTATAMSSPSSNNSSTSQRRLSSPRIKLNRQLMERLALALAAGSSSSSSNTNKLVVQKQPDPELENPEATESVGVGVECSKGKRMRKRGVEIGAHCPMRARQGVHSNHQSNDHNIKREANYSAQVSSSTSTTTTTTTTQRELPLSWLAANLNHVAVNENYYKLTHQQAALVVSPIGRQSASRLSQQQQQKEILSANSSEKRSKVDCDSGVKKASFLDFGREFWASDNRIRLQDHVNSSSFATRRRRRRIAPKPRPRSRRKGEWSRGRRRRRRIREENDNGNCREIATTSRTTKTPRQLRQRRRRTKKSNPFVATPQIYLRRGALSHRGARLSQCCCCCKFLHRTSMRSLNESLRRRRRREGKLSQEQRLSQSTCCDLVGGERENGSLTTITREMTTRDGGTSARFESTHYERERRRRQQQQQQRRQLLSSRIRSLEASERTGRANCHCISVARSSTKVIEATTGTLCRGAKSTVILKLLRKRRRRRQQRQRRLEHQTQRIAPTGDYRETTKTTTTTTKDDDRLLRSLAAKQQDKTTQTLSRSNQLEANSTTTTSFLAHKYTTTRRNPQERRQQHNRGAVKEEANEEKKEQKEISYRNKPIGWGVSGGGWRCRIASSVVGRETHSIVGGPQSGQTGNRKCNCSTLYCRPGDESAASPLFWAPEQLERQPHLERQRERNEAAREQEANNKTTHQAACAKLEALLARAKTSASNTIAPSNWPLDSAACRCGGGGGVAGGRSSSPLTEEERRAKIVSSSSSSSSLSSSFSCDSFSWCVEKLDSNPAIGLDLSLPRKTRQPTNSNLDSNSNSNSSSNSGSLPAKTLGTICEAKTQQQQQRKLPRPRRPTTLKPSLPVASLQQTSQRQAAGNGKRNVSKVRSNLFQGALFARLLWLALTAVLLLLAGPPGAELGRRGVAATDPAPLAAATIRAGNVEGDALSRAVLATMSTPSSLIALSSTPTSGANSSSTMAAPAPINPKPTYLALQRQPNGLDQSQGDPSSSGPEVGLTADLQESSDGFLSSASDSSSANSSLSTSASFGQQPGDLGAGSYNSNSNNSNNPDAMEQPSFWDKLLNFARIFIMSAIIVGDICGNSLVILSVCRHSKLRVTTNWFVVSLACADILVALFAMTFNASVIISGRWLFNSWVCDFWNSCDVLASTASILHLCCISIDRYIAIMRPLDYPMKITTKRVMYALLAVWVSSALLSCIPIFTGIYTTSEHMQWLKENPDQCEFVVNRVYAIVSSSISFWIPCCIMVFTYYRIYREATRQEKFIYKAQSMMPAPMVNHHHNNHHSKSSGSSTSGTGNKSKQRRSKSMAVSSSSTGSNEARIKQLASKQQQQEMHLSRPLVSEKQRGIATTNLNSGLLPTPTPAPAEPTQQSAAAESQPLTGSAMDVNNNGNGNQAPIKSLAVVPAVTSGSSSGAGNNNSNNYPNNNDNDEEDDQNSDSGQSTPTKRSISKMKREHKAAKTLGIIMGAFIVCWLPFFSWYTPMNICGHACDGMIPRGLVTFLFWVGYFNSTLNPVIYAYFNHEFRDAFKKTLQWLFCCCNDLKCLRVNRPNDNQRYNCTYRSTQEIGLVNNS